jgi:hypothetical protein
MCSPLIGLQHACQKVILGGARRLYMIYARDLENEFLTYDIARTIGFYEGGIPLKAGKGIVEIEAWYDTTKFDTEMKTGAGFTHSLEFKTLGYEADVTRLISLLVDYPVNAIVEGNDGTKYWIGQKHVPLLFEVKALLPEKGTARKEVTFTAKQDGLSVPIMPLGEIFFDWLPEWSFQEYLDLVNREFDLSFEVGFG